LIFISCLEAGFSFQAVFFFDTAPVLCGKKCTGKIFLWAFFQRNFARMKKKSGERFMLKRKMEAGIFGKM